jgi:hypothetical protein
VYLDLRTAASDYMARTRTQYYSILLQLPGVHFIMFLSIAALMQRDSAFVGAFHDSCCVQGYDTRHICMHVCGLDMYHFLLLIFISC